MGDLELWGGIECTVNRVGNRFTDQVRLSGHEHRLADLDRIAETGIKRLRYPALWERVAPSRPDDRDWSWLDERMNRLRMLKIAPILGLVHHGSGPRYTSLIDDGFAAGLATHALATAERYPWVRDWTPVNEPLTTARFSALYGHWYPHGHEERQFWLALLNQIDAVRLAMRAVRSINPQARLIQTDDLGRTYATAAVRQQAAFDNARRWMSWDLLCGKVTPRHPLWKRVAGFGLADRLRSIAEDPCPPDVIGVNHYLTSDRFLDHRIQRYAEALHGGNGHQPYADTEAVRVLEPPPPGLAGVLREAWQRYGIPVAVTEAHNGCTREEQMRWMLCAWEEASRLRKDGVPVEAVTSWALLGSVGWNTLLTAPGSYEPGAFDVSAGEPRPTALVELLKSVASGSAAHPVTRLDGWWRRPIRLHHPPVPRPAPMREQLSAPVPQGSRSVPPLLIAGRTGTLGRALARACEFRNIAYVLAGRTEMNLDDEASIAGTLDRLRPWAVINAAGWVRVDEAEHEPQACLRANADGAVLLARLAAERDVPTASISSDLVFDGKAKRTYVERAPPSPLSVYGRSKAAMEAEIARLSGTHLVVRTAAFFSPHDPYNFAMHVVRTLSQGDRFAAANDAVVSPTFVPDLCSALLDLVIDGADGIWHLSNGEALSWAEFARRLAGRLDLDAALIDARPGSELGWIAPRPSFAGLASERGALLPPLDQAIGEFAAAIQREQTLSALACR